MKRNFKNIIFTAAALLSTTCHVMGMEEEPIKEHELRHSKPLYAAYLSHTARENIENLLNEVMTVLSDEILMKNGLQPWDLLNASKKSDFNVDEFIPNTLTEDIYEAVRTVAVHYAYLNSVRSIWANSLSCDINLNFEEDIKSVLQDCKFTITEMKELKKGNCKIFQAIQTKQVVVNEKGQYQAPQPPETRVLYFASVPSPFSINYSTTYLSILFMNEPTGNLLEEELDDRSSTLQKIIDAYNFMKSYDKVPSSNHMSDFIEAISAGAELKDALDCYLGTKHVNLQQGPMYFGGNRQHDYLKRDLLVKGEEIKALQAELDDSTLTDQRIRSKLETALRIARAEEKGLTKSIELLNIQAEQDAENGYAQDMYPAQLIEQAKMRQKVLLILKKAGELFPNAFSESQDSRLTFIKKHFDITK